LALFAFMACLHFGASRAAAYDMGDFDWCFNTMPRVYDRAFEACVDANCTRISNKKVSQKRGCYQTCKGEAVEACLTQRAQGPAPKTVTRAQPAQAPVKSMVQDPAPATPAARSTAAVPKSAPVPAAPEQAEREGFFSRLLGGFGGEPEQPAAAPQSAAIPGAAPAPAAEGTGRRDGFFTRIANGLSEGITDGFDGDYNWCRDHSGGHFQNLLQDCTRGCLAGPSGSANKRQGCIQSCRSSSVRACIAKRDGK
tara:strand:- start:39 stop:797 length:759 start_codon:yes stop_codon:yes gene_type:complete